MVELEDARPVLAGSCDLVGGGIERKPRRKRAVNSRNGRAAVGRGRESIGERTAHHRRDGSPGW